MKKLIAIAVIAFCAAYAVFSEESEELKLYITGEARTGFFVWSRESDVTTDNELGPDKGANIHNSELDDWMGFHRLDNDDKLKIDQGLYRLNFHIAKGDIGAKFRFEMADFATGAVNWEYAFLYGSFFDDQFRTAAGKLGESPWWTGERELDKELDTTVGMRFEYLPSFVPGLELGFVLNNWNTPIPSGVKATLNDLLSETVLGISYTHDYFHARFAYRLDSDVDHDVDSMLTDSDTKEIAYSRDQGGRITYRVEERVLGDYLPDFQIWGVGYFENVGNKYKPTGTNYLYAQYDPYNFTARLRLGYDISRNVRPVVVSFAPYKEELVVDSRQWFSLQPSFYYKLFDNLLNVGLAFEFAKDFGKGIVSPASYLSWYVEPQIRVNIDRSFYVALVYRYHDDYYQLDYGEKNPDEPKQRNPEPYNTRTHWVNLRAVFTF